MQHLKLQDVAQVRRAVMSTPKEQVRPWQGPVVFSYGFRVFFLASAVWASLSMLLWIPMITGVFELPTAFDPISWHAHEFLFAYLNAVVAGFLLTAIPNWTGRTPISGFPLVMLFSLWMLGRIAVAGSALLPASVVALLDVAMPVMLAGLCLREIIAGKNWRNLIVIALQALLIIANLIFHWEVWRGEYAAQGYGMRLGVSAMLLMIGLIGGRIVPAFTRNWLMKSGATKLPTPPMQKFDRLALLALVIALLCWVILEDHWLAGLGLVAAGGIHAARLGRWQGHQTLSDPLVLILHVSYLFLSLGLLALGSAILAPDLLDLTAAQHLLMAGVMGTMTLAVMTRATLGHTGRPLAASKGTVFIYIAIILSVLTRFAVTFLPDIASRLYDVSGLLWILAFAGYAIVYGPMLLKDRQ